MLSKYVSMDIHLRNPAALRKVKAMIDDNLDRYGIQHEDYERFAEDNKLFLNDIVLEYQNKNGTTPTDWQF